MIEATQKKLRETRFFLRQLIQNRMQIVQTETEAFHCYLSAFLSAARSVTFVLQSEEKTKYDAWFPSWFDGLTEEEHQLMDFQKDQRNDALKKGGPRTNADKEYLPLTKIYTETRGHTAYHGFQWFGPLGIPPPSVGRTVHFFEQFGDSEKEVTATCGRYFDLLEKLVHDFIRVHSP